MKNYYFESFFYALGLVPLFYAGLYLELDIIVLACLLTIFIFILLGKKHPQIGAAFYAGTFAGMVSPSLITEWHYLLLMVLIGPFMLHYSKSLIPNMGGRLGTVSFITCLITYGVKWIFT